MDEHLQRIFVGEIARQCQFARVAAAGIGAALNAEDQNGVWYSVQALLVAVGNISKLLWPKPENQQRGDTLRQLLGVAENSVLASRTFRNRFEHFDEKLEDWAKSSNRRCFIDSNIGLAGRIAGVDIGDYLRNFEPQHGIVTFQGDTYELEPIIRAVVALHEKALATR